MPPIFKALASITVWILFINGCLGLVLSAIARLAGREALGALFAWAISITSLILAVAAMKLRKMLE
jgi:hypothetical protein